jgi:recombinational DNA repair protein RecT
MSKSEIQAIANMSKFPNDLYFNDKKDPENWMQKKTCLKQLAKLMPKSDDRLKKAIAMDDNVEGGGYLVLDDTDTVRVVQGTIIGKKNTLFERLKNNSNDVE